MNSDTKQPSNEMLNAFVDGDLDSSDYLEILSLSQRDSAAAQQLAELQIGKHLVQEAYQRVPQPQRNRPTHNSHPLRRIAAMLLLTVVAAGSGWVAGKYQGSQETMAELAASGDLNELIMGDELNSQRVVLHLTSADPVKMAASLDQAELILAGNEFSANPPYVEIVANGAGLTLFRADTSPFIERIAKLQAAYPNLSLIACARAVQQLHQQGIETSIIPGVDTGSTANQRINTRSQQGWEYEVI